MPEVITDLIEHLGGVYVPEGVEHTDAAEVYELMQRGRCMACTAPLGDNTVAFVTKHGVAAMYCSGTCVNDHQIMGWMSETYADMKQAMDFRGGQHG